MADNKLKNPENVPGQFYVDQSCIDCDICRSAAPEFFQRFDSGGYSIVVRQPQTPGELALANEAMAECPSESIGSDGECDAGIAAGDLACQQKA